MGRTRGVLIACALLLVLVAAPAAHADGFVARQSLPGFVSLFAASADEWVAVTDEFPLKAYASRDAGATWAAVPLNGTNGPQSAGGLSVGPDGAFYLMVRDQDGFALERMARGAASFERMNMVLAQNAPDGVSAPAWDESGRAWVALIAQGRLIVQSIGTAVILSGGSAPVSFSGTPKLEYAGGKLYADSGSGVYQSADGTLRQISGTGTRTFGSNWPVLAVGRTIVTESGLSLDDGATFHSREGESLLPVHGAASLLVGQGFQGDDGGRVLTAFSASVYRPSALTVPQGTRELWQTPQGLVAFAPGGDGAISIHTGAVPKLTVDGRGITATGRAMIARANYYRRAAGLPPLLADRLIAQASLNHARYWSGRALPRGHLLDVHGETPGTRGFTGQTPEERCKHVGGDCGSEVMNFGNQAEHPVDSWVATPFHREPFISPGTVAAGAARVGRIAVMDFSFLPENVALAPIEFPRGRYSGTLVFPGNEAPDPLAACRAAHQPLGPQPSIPVSFVPPVSTSKPAVVALFRGRARVPGCGKVGFFMARSHLAPHTRYTAKATWQAADGGPTVTTVWTFKTA